MTVTEIKFTTWQAWDKMLIDDVEREFAEIVRQMREGNLPCRPVEITVGDPKSGHPYLSQTWG